MALIGASAEIAKERRANTVQAGVLIIVVAVVVVFLAARSVTVVQPSTAAIVERFAKFRTVLDPGVHFLLPFADRIRAKVSMREEHVAYPPHRVITQDEYVVSVDAVVYFQIVDARAAVYDVPNYLAAVEQLVVSQLRAVIGAMPREQALTSARWVGGRLGGDVDAAARRWGIRVARVDVRSIKAQFGTADSDRMEPWR